MNGRRILEEGQRVHFDIVLAIGNGKRPMARNTIFVNSKTKFISYCFFRWFGYPLGRRLVKKSTTFRPESDYI